VKIILLKRLDDELSHPVLVYLFDISCDRDPVYCGQMCQPYLSFSGDIKYCREKPIFTGINNYMVPDELQEEPSEH
jgi:hypothetical protein